LQAPVGCLASSTLAVSALVADYNPALACNRIYLSLAAAPEDALLAALADYNPALVYNRVYLSPAAELELVLALVLVACNRHHLALASSVPF